MADKSQATATPGESAPAAAPVASNPTTTPATQAPELGGDDAARAFLMASLEADPGKVVKGTKAADKLTDETKTRAGDSDEDEAGQTDAEVDDEPEADETEAEDEGDGQHETESEEEEESEEDESAEEEEEEATEGEEEDADGPDVKGVPKPLKKRFRKLWEDAKQAKARVTELEQKLEKATVAPVPLQSKSDPLGAVTTLSALDETLERAKAKRKFLMANPTGWEGTVDGREISFEASDIAEMLEETEAVLEAAPTRRAYLQQRETHRPRVAAEKVYPDMFKEGTPEHAMFQQVLKECPDIVRVWDYEMLIGHYLRGFREFADEQKNGCRYTRVAVKPKAADEPAKGAKKPAGSKPKPPVTTRTTAPVRPASQAGKGDAEAALRKAEASGREEDLRAALSASLSDW